MRILKIELCNLASLAGEQVIDFTTGPLQAANLYAITGDTGTGKSTILDAICLAIYAKVPRLEDANFNNSDMDSIMRRGSNHCYARVTFATGNKRYRASWKTSRTRTGSLSTPTQTLEELSPTPHTLYQRVGVSTQREIAEITGLTYEQFTRTVLLAQNSFANFLKADTAEKANLLEKITGTEIYRALGQEAHTRYRQADSAVQTHKAKMQGATQGKCLEPVEAEEQRTQLHKLTSQQAENDTQQQRITKLLKWHTDKQEAETAVEKANATYAQAVQQLNLNATEAARLQRYDSVSHLRDDFQAVKRLKNEIQKTREVFTALKNKIDELTATEKVDNDKLLKAEADLNNASEQLKLRRPIIEQGLRLQTKIDENEKALNDETEEQNKIQKEYDENAITLNKLRSDIATLEQKSKEIDHYFTQNNRHEQLIKDYQRVELQLKQLSELHQNLTKYAQERTQLLKQHDDLMQAETKATEANNEKKQLVAEAEAELQLKEQSIVGQELNALYKQQEAQKEQISLINTLTPIWKRIVDQSQEYDTTTFKLKSETTKQEQLATDLATQKQRVAQREKEDKDSSKRYAMSTNISVIEMRQELQSGQPCPVCGSGHHPWHTEQAQEAHKLGLLTEELRLAMEEAQQLLQEERDHYDTLVAQESANTTKITSLTQKQQQLANALKTDRDSWNEKAVLVQGLEPKAEVSNDHEVRLSLQQLLDQHTLNAEDTKKKIDELEVTQRAIDTLKIQLETLRQTARTSEDELKKVQQNLKDNRRDQDKNTQAHQEAYDKAATLESDISATISIDDWQSNIDATATQIKNIYREWTQKQSEQEGYREELSLLSNKFTAAKTKAETLEQNKLTLNNKIESYDKALYHDKQALHAEFPELKPSEEQEQLTKRERSCRESRDNAARAYNDSKLKLKETEGQLSSKKEDLDTYEAEHTKAEARLQNGIKDFNAKEPMLESNELHDLFEATTDWHSLRHTINNLKLKCIEAKHTFDTASTALNTLLTSPLRTECEEHTHEDLATQEQTLKEASQALQATINDIQYKLRQHDEATKLLGTLQEELLQLEQDLRYWKEIDGLIGGGKGDNFSKHVQAYTFQFLLQYANQQLQQINRRYRLVPGEEGDLSFAVEDLDLGGTLRHSASLSGGETFIVSLALALALSNLSTGTARIESLFIDEGFGTLDTDSLNLVMQTLDRLHSTQNRQVGIISHAEAIKQQVHPRIEVRRTTQAGASNIHITE